MHDEAYCIGYWGYRDDGCAASVCPKFYAWHGSQHHARNGGEGGIYTNTLQCGFTEPTGKWRQHINSPDADGP
jgi:hypothetical protein